MKQVTERTSGAEDLGTCITGRSTESPCPRPAVKVWGDSPLCKEHYHEAEVSWRSDELERSLELLEAFVYEARGSCCEVLVNDLERVQAGLRERLSDTNGLLEMLTGLADNYRERPSES